MLEAARAAQSGRAHGVAKGRDGSVEAIRVLVVAKRSARGARIKALTQMRQLTFSERPVPSRGAEAPLLHAITLGIVILSASASCSARASAAGSGRGYATNVVCKER